MKKVKVITNTEFLKKYKELGPEGKLGVKQTLTNCQAKLKAPVWKKKMFKR